MATTVADALPRARERTLSARIVKAINKTPIHIALAIVALIWLAPTVGLLITSFRDRSDIQVTGWWEAIFQFRWMVGAFSEASCGV